jgi:hypothetical protein
VTVLSFGLGDWKVLRMTPWIKCVEESKKFLTLYLPPCILQKQTHTWAREVRVHSMLLVKARRLVRKGTAPVCLVPVDVGSVLIQIQEMMMSRRGLPDIRTTMLEGEEEETAKVAEAVRLPRIPRSRRSRTMSSSLTLGTRMMRAGTTTSGFSALGHENLV